MHTVFFFQNIYVCILAWKPLSNIHILSSQERVIIQNSKKKFKYIFSHEKIMKLPIISVIVLNLISHTQGIIYKKNMNTFF